MQFIDHTGHIFEQESHFIEPIGYEYNENPYVFWFDSEYGFKLSINNYYFKPIRLLLPIDNNLLDINNINIKIENSSIFKLLGSKQVQDLLASKDTFLGNLELSEDLFVNELNYSMSKEDDLLLLPISDNGDMVKASYKEKHYVGISYNNDELKEYISTGISYQGFSGNVDDIVYINGETCYKDSVLPDNVYSILYHNEHDEDLCSKYISFKEIPSDCICVYVSNDGKTGYKKLFNTNTQKFYDFEEKYVDIELNDNQYKYIKDGYYYGNLVNYEGIKYVIVPFYVVCYSKEEGTWNNNILIKLIQNNEESWTPITVGGEFVDECEELVINGKNMGVSLPKQILKAVYNANYYSEYPDERTYALKLKEYLMNFMKIKGEQGNYSAVINGVKWFGWGDKISLYKLINKDNIYKEQYIRDNFDIFSDSIKSFENLRNATLLSLSVKTNAELKETYQDYSKELWGEGKPEYEDLFEKMIPIKYDETDIVFYRGYFDYTMQDLGLKLCALRYYFAKYFLPVHLGIQSASLEYQTWMNDIKLITKPTNIIVEHPVLTNYRNTNYEIVFPKEHTLVLKHEKHYVDTNYCDFVYCKEYGEKNITDIYYIDDTVVNIPIQFKQKNSEELYNCILILKKDNNVIHECTFSFVQKTGIKNRNTLFNSFVIHPKTLNTILTGNITEKFNINNWLDSKYTLFLCVNNNWYNYDFNIIMPELNIDYGKLVYKYNLPTSKEYKNKFGEPSLFKQISSIQTSKRTGNDEIIFNAFMYQPDLVTVTNSDFIEEIVLFAKNNNVTYIDGSKINPGKHFYYIEYNGYKYIMSPNNVEIIKQNKENIFEIINNPTFLFKYNGDGTYSLLDKQNHTKIINLELRSSIYDNLQSYINKYYKDNINFIPNKYRNNIHLINIYKEVNGNISPINIPVISNSILGGDDDKDELGMFVFGDIRLSGITGLGYLNSTKEIVDLYKIFFDKDGNSIFGENIRKRVFDKNHTLVYDPYIMHDKKIWYMVLISEETIDNCGLEDLKFYYSDEFNTLTIDNNGNKTYSISTLPDGMFYKIVNNIDDNNEIYYLEYNKTSTNILINRLDYESLNGVNHFNSNDIITCTLVSNDKLPYKLMNGSKWTFTPITIGNENKKLIKSNTEMAILSLHSDEVKYSRGYYNITCGYTIDDFTEHYSKVIGKICID